MKILTALSKDEYSFVDKESRLWGRYEVRITSELGQKH
jgi:hypothetical protein